jgi:hypothetical protein
MTMSHWIPATRDELADPARLADKISAQLSVDKRVRAQLDSVECKGHPCTCKWHGTMPYQP